MLINLNSSKLKCYCKIKTSLTKNMFKIRAYFSLKFDDNTRASFVTGCYFSTVNIQ